MEFSARKWKTINTEKSALNERNINDSKKKKKEKEIMKQKQNKNKTKFNYTHTQEILCKYNFSEILRTR